MNVSDQEIITDALYRFNVVSNKFEYLSPVLERICGLRPEEIVSMPTEKMLDMIHPADQVEILRIITRAFSDSAESNSQVIFRFRHTDGQWRWLLNKFRFIRDENGGLATMMGSVSDITERKQLENRLVQSENNLNAVFNSTDEMIFVVAADESLIALNDAAVRNLGRPREELVGQKIGSLLPPEVFHRRRPFIDQALLKGVPVTFEDEREGKCMINHLYPVQDEDGKINSLVVFSRDISEYKLSEKALIDSEDKYRRLFESATLGIFQSTPDGEAISVNPAFARMFGYESVADALANLKNVSVDLFVDPNRRNEIIRMMELNPDLKTFENLYRRKDGTTFTGNLNSIPVRDSEGRLLRIEGIIEDISERKLAEERLNRKKEQLQKLNAEKDKFFSIIAHDLRSPFHAILGLTELLSDGLEDFTFEETRAAAASLRNSARKLFQLTENLLEWSRIQAGLSQYNPEPFHLSVQIKMALELSLVAAAKKSISVKMEIPDDLEVMADRRMFDSLVMNVVSNAVKFTPKGGKINLWAESIPVHTIMISIKDSGIGIKQEMIGRLFNLDEQTSRPGTEGEPSIGLGLIICKDIVEKHGGKIWVVSQPEKGSTFRFTLPAKPPVTDPL